MNERIKVDNIESKKTQKSSKPYWVITSGGRGFTCWNSEAALLLPGNLIDAEIESKNGFLTINSFNLVSETVSKSAEKQDNSDKNNSIIAQVILKCATELAASQEDAIKEDEFSHICSGLVKAYKSTLSLLNDG